MAYEFTQTHRVEFSDTDMAGIMHFANFFRFMEATEHSFFRSLGLSIHTEVEGRSVTWPRVASQCDYRSPLRFEEQFDVRLRVTERRAKAVTYGFTFLRHGSGEEIARGSVTAVCVAVDRESGQMKAIAIPPAFDAIEQAPGD